MQIIKNVSKYQLGNNVHFWFVF
jgi:dynein heavy chain 1